MGFHQVQCGTALGRRRRPSRRLRLALAWLGLASSPSIEMERQSPRSVYKQTGVLNSSDVLSWCSWAIVQKDCLKRSVECPHGLSLSLLDILLQRDCPYRICLWPWMGQRVCGWPGGDPLVAGSIQHGRHHGDCGPAATVECWFRRPVRPCCPVSTAGVDRPLPKTAVDH